SDSTSTRLPPTSLASDPSVAIDETTCNVAISAIMSASKRVRSVRANGNLELEECGGRPFGCDHWDHRAVGEGEIALLDFGVGADAHEFAALERHAECAAGGARSD